MFHQNPYRLEQNWNLLNCFRNQLRLNHSSHHYRHQYLANHRYHRYHSRQGLNLHHLGWSHMLARHCRSSHRHHRQCLLGHKSHRYQNQSVHSNYHWGLYHMSLRQHHSSHLHQNPMPLELGSTNRYHIHHHQYFRYHLRN